MRVLVCGATYFTDYEKFHNELMKVFGDRDLSDVTIISGMAKGADTMAVRFASQYEMPCLKFPADWKRYGLGAGPIRNQLMLDQGKPDLIIAFPMQSSRGTRDMINRGLMEDVEVIVIEV